MMMMIVMLNLATKMKSMLYSVSNCFSFKLLFFYSQACEIVEIVSVVLFFPNGFTGLKRFFPRDIPD